MKLLSKTNRTLNLILTLSFISLTSLLLLNPRLVFACAGACTVDADCSANPCRYCDTGFERCADCCEYVDQLNCPSACSWHAGSSECRNDGSTACGVLVPETPSQFKTYFLIFILASLTGTAFYGKFRSKKKN